MGDTLAKWYEGKPTYDQTPDPSPSLQAALALSTQVKETIFDCGLEAKRDADAGKNSPAVEKMVEANILLAGIIGGIGGTKFRVALAHGLLYGLTVLPKSTITSMGRWCPMGSWSSLAWEKMKRSWEG